MEPFIGTANGGNTFPGAVVQVRSHTTILVNVHSSQEVCPWNVRFAPVAAERGHAPWEALDAVWDRDSVADVSG